ncbi:hypothetical protein C0992_012562 [Termitomyces sp. T32_za158]|nr:hypothetical protein C0992_012562 [Termitomyces sp. T32_za158]
MATLSPSNSPKAVRRRGSTRRRAGSYLPAYPSQESHDAALNAIRIFLKAHTAYDAFPVSFRLIVLDTKLNVKKALQCLLLNGLLSRFTPVSASSCAVQASYLPLYGTAKSPVLPACLLFWISYISSNIITTPQTMIPPAPMLKPSVSSPCEVDPVRCLPSHLL